MSISKTTSDAFYEALDTIIENKMQNAGYDSTIHCIIDSIVSEGQGLYNVKYQGSILTNVRSASPSISYQVGQQVIVTLPNGLINSPNKYISNSLEMKTNAYRNVEGLGTVAYTQLGKNGVNVKSCSDDLFKDNVFQISSYKSNEYTIYTYDSTKEQENERENSKYFSIDQSNIIKNLQKGNGLIIGCALQTMLDFGQTGGEYGIEIDVDTYEQYTGVAATHTYVVGSRQINGNPFAVNSATPVKIFLDNVKAETFKCISAIRLYCKDFLIQATDDTDSRINLKDIFISDIFISGGRSTGLKKATADAILLIDASDKINLEGNTLTSEQTVLKLKAQLLIQGKKVTQGVKYLWFKENGSVINRSSTESVSLNDENKKIFNSTLKTFSRFGGLGWNCVNKRSASNSNNITRYTSPVFYFTTKSKDRVLLDDDLKEKVGSVKNFEWYNACIEAALQKVKCVAIYDDENSYVEALYTIFNLNVDKRIIIVSSDRLYGKLNQTTYFLNNGSPTLTCKVYDKVNNKNEDITNTCTFIWYKKDNNGKTFKIESVNEDNYSNAKKYFSDSPNGWEYIALHSDKITAKKIRTDNLGINDPNQKYTPTYSYPTKYNSYTKAKVEYDKYYGKNASFCRKNQYIHYPISTIFGSVTLICSVSKEGVYFGSAEITLENKILLSEKLSLELVNATQVFKYDNKGNSPTSPQFENSKNKIEIQPLSFNFVSADGQIISFNRIKQLGGVIKWLLPNSNTLLSVGEEMTPDKDTSGKKITGDQDLVVSNAGLPLPAASYNVFTDKLFFTFGIANVFNDQYVNNDIVLLISYQDDIYIDFTNFTFPKLGDSGTNGTDYFALIKTGNDSERLYINNYGNAFDDNDDFSSNAITLSTRLYNNSEMVLDNENNPITTTLKILGATKLFSLNNNKIQNNNYWTLPTSDTDDYKWETGLLDAVFRSFIRREKIVHIIRATYEIDQLKIYALKPICYNIVKDKEGSFAKYRFKIKSKTGFQYVTYADDGTRPLYRNLPFELLVQELVGNGNTAQYKTNITSNLMYQWFSIGGVEVKKGRLSNIVTYLPYDYFDGENLVSGVFCAIYKDSKTSSNLIGILYAPIYMCINRYGHQALNEWDGNSIQLDAGGNTTILAPQVGAGQKDKDKPNTFTGIVMGVEHTTVDSKTSLNTGLFGYHQGQRTIFLNAESGSAEFGVNNAGKITIDPATTIAYYQSTGTIQDWPTKPAALLYSQTFDKDKYINEYAIPSSERTHTYVGGMMLDLTSPAIAFGSGNFFVEPNGEMTASAGNIAGWKILKTRFLSPTGSMYLRSTYSLTPYNMIYAHDQGTFRVTNEGKVYADAGLIAGWNISSVALTNDTGKVGLGSTTIDNNTAKIWSISDNDKFYVTNSGKVVANAGQIANWTISDTALFSSAISGTTTKNVGMGTSQISLNGDENAEAKIWSYSYDPNRPSGNKRHYFYVTTDGYMECNSGKIGGWLLSNISLSSSTEEGSITINKNGSITGSNSTQTWTIKNTGYAYFNDINATGGKIGGWNISSTSLQSTNGNVTLYATGKLEGPNDTWYINSNGNAYFKSVKYLDGNMGGGSLSGGNSVDATNFGTGGGDGTAFNVPVVNGQLQINKAAIGELLLDDLQTKTGGGGKHAVYWLETPFAPYTTPLQYSGNGFIPVYSSKSTTSTILDWLQANRIVVALNQSALYSKVYLLCGTTPTPTS